MFYVFWIKSSCIYLCSSNFTYSAWFVFRTLASKFAYSFASIICNSWFSLICPSSAIWKYDFLYLYLSTSQLQQAYQDKEEENQRLKHYIDTILLNIVENYPQLLEVKPSKPVQNEKISH